MHPTLSSFYKVPQSYYVPRRIRQVYQARLEGNGFWITAAEESEVEKPKRFGEKEAEKDDPKQIFKNTFQRERVSHSSGPPSTTSFIDCNRSWKSHAQPWISTQGYWATRDFSTMIGALDNNDVPCACRTDRVFLKADDARFVTSRAYPASHPCATPRHIDFVAPEFVVPNTHLTRTMRPRRRNALCARASTRAIYTKCAAALLQFPRLVEPAASTQK